jgi:hypothetical protein
MGYKSGSNWVMDENAELLADFHSIYVSSWSILWSYWMYIESVHTDQHPSIHPKWFKTMECFIAIAFQCCFRICIRKVKKNQVGLN